MASPQDMENLRAKQQAFKDRMLNAGLRAKQDAFKGRMRDAVPPSDKLPNSPLRLPSAKNTGGATVASVPKPPATRPDLRTIYLDQKGGTQRGVVPTGGRGMQPPPTGNVYEGEFTRQQPRALPDPGPQARSAPGPEPDYRKIAAEKTEAAQIKQNLSRSRAADMAAEKVRAGQRTAAQADLSSQEARAKRGYATDTAATKTKQAGGLRAVAGTAAKGLGIAGAALEGKRVYDDVKAADSTAGQVEAAAAGGARIGSAAAGAKLAMAAAPKHKAVQAVAGLAGGIGGYMAGEKVSGLRRGSTLGEVWEATTGDGEKDKYSHEQYRAQELEAAGLPPDYNEDIPIIGPNGRPLNTPELDSQLAAKNVPPRSQAQEAAVEAKKQQAEIAADEGEKAPAAEDAVQGNKYDVLGNEGLRRRDLNAEYKPGQKVDFGKFGGQNVDGGIIGTADANGRMNSFTGRGMPQQRGGLGDMFGAQSPYASSGNPGGVSDAELAIGRFGRANAIRQQALDEEAQRSGGGRINVISDPNYRPSLSEVYANKIQASKDKAFGVAQIQADAMREAAQIRADGAERAGLARAGNRAEADPYKQYKNMIDARKAEYELDRMISGDGLRDREAKFKQLGTEFESANQVRKYTEEVIKDAHSASNNGEEIEPGRMRAIYAGIKSDEGIAVGVGPDGKEIRLRVNELDPNSSEFHNVATRAVHFDNAKNVFRDFLTEHGLKASIVDEPGFFEKLSVNTKGEGINQNYLSGATPYSVPQRIMNRLFGSGNSVTLQGAYKGRNVDMMYDDLMDRLDKAGATDYFKELLGQ